MKKLVLFLLIFASFSICSMDISFEEGFPDETRLIIEEALIENTAGRGDISYSLHDYKEEDGRISFSISFDGKESTIVFPSDEEKVQQSVSKEIRNLLFYEKGFSKEGLTLSYIYKDSYSAFAPSTLEKGSLYRAVDDAGEPRAIFAVKGMEGQYALLRPLYEDRVFPGMRLESSSPWSYGISLASTMDFNGWALWAEGGNLSLLWPFTTKASIGALYESGAYYAFLGIGIEASLYLNDAFPLYSFTLIKEGRIGASSYLTIGGGSEGFALDALYSVFYEHRALPNLSWRVGYAVLPGMRGSISLSVGGFV